MINKSVLLCSAITIVILSTSTFAENRNGFYLKGSVGANKMSETEEKPIKSRSKLSPSFSIGLGYYLNDYLRHDLTLDYSSISFENGSANITEQGFDPDYGNYIFTGNGSVDRKASVYSMMFNNYIDLPITDNSKLFFGGGIGLAQIKEKINAKIEKGKIQVENNFIHIPNYTNSSSTKKKLNFAYSLMIGTSVKVTPITTIEIVYSWKDFGVTKTGKWRNDGDKVDKNRYNGHSCMAGIRFDI